MIFKSIKIGMCIGLGAWSALNTYIAVNGFTKYFIKKFIASAEKKSEKEEKQSAGVGGNFTYKDED